MANLVGSGESQIVGSGASTGDGAEKDGATVVQKVIGVVDVREVAVSEKITAETHEVYVESLVVTLSESLLHGGFVTVLEPTFVGGAGRSKKVERDTSRSVTGVQYFQLFHRKSANETIILENRRSHTWFAS